MHSILIRVSDLPLVLAGLTREGISFEVTPESEGEYRIRILGY